ncbi:hypothetical protein PR001_g16677 [Phytophthora rubi]|uniref:Uncharacterized protein n=1 Tax=Phytophthora rubi TaxID=129364 RepID=A0A6A3KSS0_9STRA|nr:hypothetical protein PR001_g16677 [Phytophthora rubi]
MAGGDLDAVADAPTGAPFLPDLTEPSSTTLDYSGPNIQTTDLQADQQAKLVTVLRQHEDIMIASGNALPPPAYGVVPPDQAKGSEDPSTIPE